MQDRQRAGEALQKLVLGADVRDLRDEHII